MNYIWTGLQIHFSRRTRAFALLCSFRPLLGPPLSSLSPGGIVTFKRWKKNFTWAWWYWHWSRIGDWLSLGQNQGREPSYLWVTSASTIVGYHHLISSFCQSWLCRSTMAECCVRPFWEAPDFLHSLKWYKFSSQVNEFIFLDIKPSTSKWSRNEVYKALEALIIKKYLLNCYFIH